MTIRQVLRLTQREQVGLGDHNHDDNDQVDYDDNDQDDHEATYC